MMSLLARMNPTACLGGSLTVLHADDVRGTLAGPPAFGCLGAPGCYPRYRTDDAVAPPPAGRAAQALGRAVPGLLAAVAATPPGGAARTGALQALHDLTAGGKEYNLVPLLRSKQWDVLGTLSAALLVSMEGPGKTTIDGATTVSTKPLPMDTPSADEDRRLILWTLVNLSVPRENKVAMVLGDQAAGLLEALTAVLRANPPDAHLSCLCLFRLTVLAEAIRPVTFYAPSAYGDGTLPYAPPASPPRSRSLAAARAVAGGRPPTSPFSRSRSLRPRSRSASASHASEGRTSEICGLVLGNPASLLRVLERMLASNASFLLSAATSAQGQAVRWACGFVRNVTYLSEGVEGEEGRQQLGGGGGGGRQGRISEDAIEEICLLIAGTEIPRRLVQCLQDSPTPPARWTKDALEDLALEGLCNLATWPTAREALRRAGAGPALEGVAGLPGVHGHRARAILCSLGALPLAFGTRVG